MRLQASAGNAAVMSLLRTLRDGGDEPRAHDGSSDAPSNADTAVDDAPANATTNGGASHRDVATAASNGVPPGDLASPTSADGTAASPAGEAGTRRLPTTSPNGGGAADAGPSPPAATAGSPLGNTPSVAPATVAPGTGVAGGAGSGGPALPSNAAGGGSASGATDMAPASAAGSAGAGVATAGAGGAATAAPGGATAGAGGAVIAAPGGDTTGAGGTATASPGQASENGSQAGPDGDTEMAEFTALVADVNNRRDALLEGQRQREQQILAAAAAEKLRFRERLEAGAIGVETAHDASIAAIRERAALDQQAVGTALDAEVARTDATAEAELAHLTAVIDAKNAALREKAATRAEQATTAGETQATRAQSGGTERTARAEAIAGEKTAQYRGGEKGGDIAEAIKSESGKLKTSLAKTSEDVAGTVRGKAADLASHFQEDAGQAAGEFAKTAADGRAKIGEARDSTRQALQKLAVEAREKIAQEAQQLIALVEGQKAQKAADVRAQADVVDASADEAAQAAVAKTTEQAQGGGWYPPFVAQARSELFAALDAEEEKVGALATSAIANMADATTIAINDVESQVQTITGAVQAVATGFADKSGDVANKAQDELRATADKGVKGLKTIPAGLDTELQKSVEQTDQKWGERLTEGKTEMSGDVDRSLDAQDDAIASFVSGIDARAARAQSAGILDGIFDFVIGAFEGLFIGAWELLKGLWEAIKSKVFWIVVAVIVIVLVVIVVVLVVFFGMEILAAIAAVWEVVETILIVVGVIMGVGAAIYYVYLMITKPNLSWRERGRLFGRAIFEIILAFAGTGILKRLGVLNDIPKLMRFVEAVGGVRRAFTLIKLLPDIDKVLLLLDRVGEVEKVVVLLEKVRDFDRLVALLDKVGDAGKLIELLDVVKDSALLLRLLSNTKIADVGALERILSNAKLGDVAVLERLLDNAKITSLAELERLLANAKITDAASLEKLLANAKITDVATLERLLANAKIGDAAGLQKLLDNAKIADVAALERVLADVKIADAAALDRLLSNPKVATVADLERLLTNAKILDAAMLERLVANAKIADVAELERLLANVKLTDVAMLERLLTDAKLADAAQLERLLNDVKIVDGAQLELLLPVVDSAQRLERLLLKADDGAQLLDFLTKIGGATEAQHLERLFGLIVAGEASRCAKLVDQVAISGERFADMVDWTVLLSTRTAGAPAVAAPPEVASLGFTGANMGHFIAEHTWEFLDIAKRLNKSTTLWPPGTAPQTVADMLGEALGKLNPTGGHALPAPGVPEATTAGGFAVQVGTLPGPSVGQFFALAQGGLITIKKGVMRAIWSILGP
jgi:hypothetical protein